jgi:hypothetical protein
MISRKKYNFWIRTSAIGSTLISSYDIEIKKKKTKTPWSESASELYRPSDRRLSAK